MRRVAGRVIAGSRCILLFARSAVVPPLRVPVYSGLRFLSTTGPSGVPPPPPGRPGGKAAAAKPALPLGCVHVDSLNFSSEVSRCQAPVMLYFHVDSHEQVRAYTSDLLKQVGDTNNLIAEKVAEKLGAAADLDKAKALTVQELGVKLSLVNVEKEPQLAQVFRVQPEMFPIVYFLWEGKVVDQLVGIVPEAHIKEAVLALVKFADEKRAAKSGSKGAAAAKPGAPDATTTDSAAASSGPAKPTLSDVDDENAMTLVQTGMRKLQEKDYSKGEVLFKKAVDLCVPKVEALRKSLGLDTKRMTPEVMEKLKKDAHYLALPQALTGLALTELGRKRLGAAFEQSQRIRNDFPWAVREQRLVADALARIDMLHVSGYDSERDTYVNLLKRDEFINEPLSFYNNNIKLAVAHYFERHYEQALEELLKLVRVEPRLLPELRKAAVCDSLKDSPARKILFLMFEGIGNDNASVIAARRKLSAFLNV